MVYFKVKNLDGACTHGGASNVAVILPPWNARFVSGALGDSKGDQ